MKILSIILTIFFGLAVNINAATLTVTKIADTNDGVCNADCSLREAIAVASAGDFVVFSSLFDSAQTIELFLTELNVNKNVTIRGKGANLLTIKGDAPNGQRVFNIPAGFIVTLSGMTIRDGSTNFAFGGGISNSGNLTVSACHITANSAAQGGGISNAGTINIINSTISNNTAVDASAGGGIENFGTLTMTNSTISGNTANGGNFCAGGISNNFGSPALITNSTITGNSANVGVSSAGGV
ncbi:MAG TPA: CSLREA domain-containing protein, partial [Pyrinomonadaceae bacterium]|nr:CSLREA domain-containing protein [Pyrinomonadaceae bacterium]